MVLQMRSVYNNKWKKLKHETTQFCCKIFALALGSVLFSASTCLLLLTHADLCLHPGKDLSQVRRDTENSLRINQLKEQKCGLGISQDVIFVVGRG